MLLHYFLFSWTARYFVQCFLLICLSSGTQFFHIAYSGMEWHTHLSASILVLCSQIIKMWIRLDWIYGESTSRCGSSLLRYRLCMHLMIYLSFWESTSGCKTRPFVPCLMQWNLEEVWWTHALLQRLGVFVVSYWLNSFEVFL